MQNYPKEDKKTVSHSLFVQFSHQSPSFTGDLPQHLQVMFKILRSEDRIKLVGIKLTHPLHFWICGYFYVSCVVCLSCISPSDPQAVRLESGWSDRVRYMVVIYTKGHQDTEENIVLGMDFTEKDR